MNLRPEELDRRVAKNRLNAAVRECALHKLDCESLVARNQFGERNQKQTFTAIIRNEFQRGEEVFSAHIQMSGSGKVFSVAPRENLSGVLCEVLDWSRRQNKKISWDYQLQRRAIK